MFDDLISLKEVTGDRAAKCTGGVERVMTEGAVMLAFAMHLFATVSGLKRVFVHPDGQHDGVFEIRPWLEKQGFIRREAMGTTRFGGLYVCKDGREVLVNPKSGVGDVVADHDGWSAVAECKGGCINSNYAGVKSNLQSGLRETIGQLLEKPMLAGQRQYAVAPWTPTTASVAAKLRPRAAEAGVEIVLLSEYGEVVE